MTGRTPCGQLTAFFFHIPDSLCTALFCLGEQGLLTCIFKPHVNAKTNIVVVSYSNMLLCVAEIKFSLLN